MVAVQLPGDSDVTHHVEIQIIDLEPQVAGRSFSVRAIQVPIDFPTVIQTLISQQVEAMLTDFLRSLDDRLDLIRCPLSERVQDPWNIFATKKKKRRVAESACRNRTLQGFMPMASSMGSVRF